MKNYFILLLSIVAFFACTKKDETSLIETLSKNNWKKTSILISVDSTTANPSDTIPNILVTPSDCAKDNEWIFIASNNTFKLDEGATKCNSGDPQIKDEGILEELNNGNSLRVDGNGTNEIWEIESRSASSFRVSYFAKNASNKTVKFRVTFSKI